ncbi:TPA: hypothetical protein PC685_002575 [Staphylococcus aureus]|uniref:hypothetical protein n=1 Tax=Staphylococcus TaxID=1279 RepID=UPI00044B99D9|nr:MULTISPECIES: hypothetical protein [Staphylococcus]HBI1053951.1 hypothetical protein [Staphylococcus aureus]EZT88923.1 hypothetical protein U922_02302 [Staphylococcus aureus 11S01420]EZV01529.1 hypothetical protein U921_02488 [Staphylococcus aureus 11S01415]HDA1764846.1 hypothetical protein [Staphylococcus aureus]HDE6684291.1 hypothetical protein [Staphylococcus aureus]
MGKINSKLEKLKKLEQEIQEEQNKIDSKLGNAIIKELELDYDDLTNEQINKISKSIILDDSSLNTNNSELNNEDNYTTNNSDNNEQA